MVRNILGQVVRGADCFGRDKEVADIWDRVQRGEHILLLGPRRTGKTSVMLKLEEAQPKEWKTLYRNVEAGRTPSDIVAEMVAALLSVDQYREGLEKFSLGRKFKSLLDKVGKSTETDSATIVGEVKSILANDWKTTLAEIQGRLESGKIPVKILFILDELPIAASKILKDKKQGKAGLEEFMDAFRAMRQRSDLAQKVGFLIGGSVGLDAMLARQGMSALTNDMNPMPIHPWEEETALDFLKCLSEHEDYPLPLDTRKAMVMLVGQCVPSHLQFFFSELRTLVPDGNPTQDHAKDCFTNALFPRIESSLLSHYDTRMDDALTEPEAAIARMLMRTVAQAGDAIPIADIKIASENRSTAEDMLDFLIKDGYLKEKNGALSIPSSLLKLYWAQKARRRFS